MARRTAVVVGGGIAGLAAATGLHAAGWRVMVLERDRRAGDLGAGLALTPNGLAAAGVIGVRGDIIAAGRRTRLMGYRDQHDEWVFRLPYSQLTAVIGIHRRRLHEILLDAARHTDLRTGATVVDVEPGDPSGSRAVVRYQQEGLRHRVQADLVIGADGLRSVVRAGVSPRTQVRYSGRTCWRGVAELPDDEADHRFVCWWGRSAEAGIVPIAPGRYYWYAYLTSPPARWAPDERAAALAAFGDWPPALHRCMRATGQVLRHDVFRLARPPAGFVRGRVVLIGDAAHAMLPTMGQGANSALEDAVSLAPTLTEDLTTGLRRFTKARWPRTRRMMVQSELMDAVGAGVSSSTVGAVRNAALGLTPTPLLERNGAWLMRWTPPV